MQTWLSVTPLSKDSVTIEWESIVETICLLSVGYFSCISFRMHETISFTSSSWRTFQMLSVAITMNLSSVGIKSTLNTCGTLLTSNSFLNGGL